MVRPHRIGLQNIAPDSLVANFADGYEPPYVVSAGKLRKRNSINRNVAVFGDSRAAVVTRDLTNHLTYGADSMFGWAQIQSDGRFQFTDELNFGVVGDTTDDALARIDTVIDADADVVCIMLGTNDRNSTELETADHTITNLETILDQLTEAGKIVVLCTDTPRGNATYTSYLLSAQQLAYHHQVRHWTLDVASRMKGVHVVDLWPLLATYDSSDGRLDSSFTYDGVHLTPVGAAKCGRAIADVLSRIYPSNFIFYDVDASSAYSADNPRGNLIAGSMAGTGGTVDANSTGTLATSWTSTRNANLNGGTVTSTFSKVARTNPTGSWQQVVLAGNTTANANPTLEIYASATNGNFSAGDYVQFVVEVEIDANPTGIKGVVARQTQTVNAVASSSSSLNPYTDDNTPGGFTGTTRLLHVTRPQLIPAGSVTSVRGRIVILLDESAEVDATIRWGNATLRKVVA